MDNAFPSLLQAGKLPVSLLSELDGSEVSFAFEFWPLPSANPSITMVSPNRLAVSSTESEVTIRVSNFGPVNFAADVTVQLSAPNVTRALTPTKVVVLREHTMITAIVPTLQDPGSSTMNLEVYKGASTEDAVLFPLSIFNPNEPKVELASPTQGYADGGVTINVALKP